LKGGDRSIKKVRKYAGSRRFSVLLLAGYYFTDLGLRNARLNFRQVEETHAMENIIFNELKVRGYSESNNPGLVNKNLHARNSDTKVFGISRPASYNQK
jgi:predicted AAA+ superfamily ATPase